MHRFLYRAVAVLSFAMLSSLACADPSSRVGRLSAVEGQVSFRSNNQAGAEAANLNWPVTSLNQISTSRNGRAELRVGSSVIQLNGDSELEILALDDDEFRLRLNYGSLYLNVKNPEVARDLKISTPHGSLRLGQPSRLRLDTEVMPDITAVAVMSGAAQFEGTAVNLKITAGKRMEINDTITRMAAARFDAFDDWSASREHLAAGDGRSESVRYVSAETTGHEELDRYGDWRVVDDFGPAWTPRNVAADWAPYRDGRWTWIEPWGWTWVDNAPWGYAPSHYGRWVWLDLRWYWVPGRMAVRPVWAPAMVGWVGGANWSMSVGGRSAPGLGWFPLAPREVYVPAYRVSPAYVERINHAYGAGMSPPSQYRNARVALTVVPQAQFAARGNIVVSGAAQPTARHEPAPRAPADLHDHGRVNAAPEGRNWSRSQDRPLPQAVSTPPVQQQLQAPLQSQAQTMPQNLSSSRVQSAPVPPAYPQPVQQLQPQGALQVAPPPRPQPASPVMQQAAPQPAPRAVEPAREPQERGRGQQPQQQAMQPPQQQATQQGGSRDREHDRERAAARQEKRQQGDRETGSALR
jgi:hypothetical protein